MKDLWESFYETKEVYIYILPFGGGASLFPWKLENIYKESAIWKFTNNF